MSVDSLVNALLALPPWLVLALVFLLPALEASAFVGLLVPGEIAIVVGGVVAHGGSLPLWAVAAAGTLGAVVGDQVGYTVGARYGDRLLARVPARVRRTGELNRALTLVRRRGAVAVVVGRWTAAFRALVPGIVGMLHVPRTTFTVANVTGAAVWATVVAVLGYAAGASYRTLERRLGLGSEILLAFVLLALAGWVLHAWRASRRRGHVSS